ncbi:hypothetical protein ACFSKW_51995 [Nonomuraea mangrovi]|uniref:Uncharacterized protein n=1 Tax=Nonomuraea mangrovi TaxID=2316207 RepID=A0ABW4TDT6_9ACTN
MHDEICLPDLSDWCMFGRVPRRVVLVDRPMRKAPYGAAAHIWSASPPIAQFFSFVTIPYASDDIVTNAMISQNDGERFVTPDGPHYSGR